MKLNRKQLKIENEGLDRFLDSLQSRLKKIKANEIVPDLPPVLPEALKFVRARLERRAEEKVGVSEQERETVRELISAKFFDKLEKRALGKNAKLTAADVRQLNQTYEIVKKIRSRAQERANRLAKGRKELEEQIANDETTAAKIAEVRGKNFEKLQKNITRDSILKGGRRGGRARAANLSADERSKIAAKASRSRKSLTKKHKNER